MCSLLVCVTVQGLDNNVTFQISTSSFDPDLVHFRKTLDFTSVDPNDLGKRILGNANI